MLSKIKAVAFDAFGTLVDITDDRKVYQNTIALSPVKIQIPLTENITYLEWFKRIFSDDICPVRFKDDLEIEVSSIQPFPDTYKVIERLIEMGIVIIIASNITSHYAKSLKRIFHKYPLTFHLSCDVGVAKPSLLYYQLLCERLDLCTSEIMMIGDSYQNDYLGPKYLGINAVHLRRDCSLDYEKLKCNNVIRSLEEIFEKG